MKIIRILTWCVLGVILFASAGHAAQTTANHSEVLKYLQDLQTTPENRTIRGLPRFGTISGAIDGMGVNITLDRTLWTITGTLNQAPINVKIDHSRMTIFGTANKYPIDLDFTWTPEKVTYKGLAAASTYESTLIWSPGSLTGFAGGAPLNLNFDIEAGVVHGTACKGFVSLSFDKVSGRLLGNFAGRAVNIVLVNLDLFDFLQHLYLFL
ncbi:MAG: hypothetical protein WA705_21330 [Candidatus Ozemobacteraceae bacterium]